ncbi:hypothetical protein [Mycobacterium sp. M23085]|uniref:hypothetical protein n=1 Tax=Mycobacterium sp. M23085 TaxID=3378087 RepID=UPI00387801BA
MPSGRRMPLRGKLIRPLRRRRPLIAITLGDYGEIGSGRDVKTWAARRGHRGWKHPTVA